MTDFTTWQRATLEQFAREARDKLVAMAQAEPVASLWVKNGVVVNAFPYPPPDPAKHDRDGYWSAKGYKHEPLYTCAPSIPEGWQLIDMGWLRAVFHVNALKVKPTASHQEVLDEVDRLLALAPKHTPKKEQ